MMAAEFDAVFERALYLLHSRHPKALEELERMRDEALGKKVDTTEVKKEDSKVSIKVEAGSGQQRSKTPEVVKVKQEIKIINNEPEASTSASGGEKDSVTETVEVESSTILSSKNPDFDDDDEDMLETVEELSSSFCETLEELSSSNIIVEKKKKKLKLLVDLSASKATMSDETDKRSNESSPEHEISSDLGIHCILCLSGKTSAVGNQLVECHECHEHYHQNCHKPNITDQNINDPRHVWYCSTCVKRMKETASTTPSSKQKQMTSSGGAFKPLNQSFKPPVKPPSFSPGSSTVNQSFNIPSLAGTSSASGASSSSASTSSGGLKSPSSTSYPRDMARNSMKRLQMVKKKAAAKNQQRLNKR